MQRSATLQVDLVANLVVLGISLVLYLSGIIHAPPLWQWSFLTIGTACAAAFWPLSLYQRLDGTAKRGGYAIFGALAGLALLGALLAAFQPKDPDRLVVGSWILFAAAIGAGLGLTFAGRGDSQLGPTSRRFARQFASVPLFIFNSHFGLMLSTLLSPVVYDGIVYRMDLTFFGSLWTIPASDLLAVDSWTFAAISFVYQTLPLYLVVAVGLLYLGGERDRLQFRRTLLSFVLIGFFGWICYLLFPVVGPLYALPFAHAEYRRWPAARIDAKLAEILVRGATVHPHFTARNCMPSLHTAWALLFAVAGWGKRWFWLLAPASAITVASTILTRVHYTTDVIFSLPFTALVWVCADRLVRRFEFSAPALVGEPRRWLRLFFALNGAFAATFFALARSPIDSTLLYWAIYLLLVIPALVLARRLVRLPVSAAADASSATTRRPDDRPVAVHEAATPAPRRATAALRSFSLPLIYAMFFCSGLTGLLYEVAFEKQLTLLFGSASRSTVTVLATYMSGLALGAHIGGRIADRVRNPLRLYGWAELLIGLICLTSPLLFTAAQAAYLSLAADRAADSAFVATLRIACGAVVVLLPALVMGATMPLLARHVSRSLSELRSRIAGLYAMNTLGAAAGALSTGYLLLPRLGKSSTILLATGINFSVALIALRRSRGAELPRATDEPADSRPAQRAEPRFSRLSTRALAAVLCLVALLAGAVTLGLEVAYVHLLAVVVGNSTYAFSLMLFAFLLGIGLGSLVVTRWKVSAEAALLRLAWTEAALGLVVLIGLLFWDDIPAYFDSFSSVQFATTFVEREFVRFSVCIAMMAGPTLLVGLAYPQVVAIATHQFSHLGRSVGRISFFNTVGNIAGVLICGTLMLRRVGSFYTIVALAGVTFVVALLLLLIAPAVRWRRPSLVAIVAICLVAGIALPRGFDLGAMTNGANVYFSAHGYGVPIDHRESMAGGLTSIHRRARRGGGAVTTMLTNGKFQGDDGPELATQQLFALYPLLHTAKRGRALVIGLGTGVSAAALLRAGFQRLDIAELSDDVSELAQRYFSRVNADVLASPKAKLHLTDGRNLLLVGSQRYDLISMEITAIWFSGAASLYSAEFYRLAEQRLSKGGVLQQWVQLHHINLRDVSAILASIRQSFRYVHLYYSGLQGVLVCSNDRAPIRLSNIEKLERHQPLSEIRQAMPGRTFVALPATLYLTPKGVDAFLTMASQRFGLPIAQLVSTDDNDYLNYSTPRGNVRSYAKSTRQNLESLVHFRKAVPIAGVDGESYKLISHAIYRARRLAPPPSLVVDRGKLPAWLKNAADQLLGPVAPAENASQPASQ